MSVRVRFAPSPTGLPHVGNIRTALFNHLFAKRHGGVHILRIEDTDRARYVEGCEQEIIKSLRYINVEWSEGPDVGGPDGPYRQSERKEAGIYEQYVQQLLDQGDAYWAFDTPEELQEMREFQQINKQLVGYFGGNWRDASDSDREQARSDGKPGVIRLKIPRNETIVIDDAIRGRIEVDSNTVDDPVLIKSDGMPTYHFAAMVDDHLMRITHVFRGEEWISSAPKHLVLFRAFGWEPPVLVHVPIIKGKDGSKLSKRHGDTSVLDFQRAGYMGEALANFISLIGWAPGGDREVMEPEEMAQAFSIEGIQPSSGVFDLDKLDWINGHYIRKMDTDQLVQRVVKYASVPDVPIFWSLRDKSDSTPDPRETGVSLDLLAKSAKADPEYAAQAIGLEQERVSTLAEFGPACKFFFVERPELEQKAVDKWFGHDYVPALLSHLIESFEGRESADLDYCEKVLRDYFAESGLEKFGMVVHPTRVALTGKMVGPGLFELMEVLGPDRMVKRLTRALAVIENLKTANT